MAKEATKMVQKCESCQKYTPRIGHPPSELILIRVAWPFVQWGIDSVGPFPKCKQKSYIIVAMDYFSKWIEAKALASTSEFQVIKFIKSRIVAIYGIQNVLVSYNDPQFAGEELKWFCEELKIEHHHTLVKHAQIVGQIEEAKQKSSSEVD